MWRHPVALLLAASLFAGCVVPAPGKTTTTTTTTSSIVARHAMYGTGPEPCTPATDCRLLGQKDVESPRGRWPETIGISAEWSSQLGQETGVELVVLTGNASMQEVLREEVPAEGLHVEWSPEDTPRLLRVVLQIMDGADALPRDIEYAAYIDVVYSPSTQTTETEVTPPSATPGQAAEGGSRGRQPA